MFQMKPRLNISHADTERFISWWLEVLKEDLASRKWTDMELVGVDRDGRFFSFKVSLAFLCV